MDKNPLPQVGKHPSPMVSSHVGKGDMKLDSLILLLSPNSIVKMLMDERRV